MGVFRIALDHYVEVCNSLLVQLDHLVRFCSLVNVAHIGWNSLDTSTERENWLFELLDSAVGKAQVVENVRFVSKERFVLEG